MAGDTERRPFRASSREMGSNPGGTESVLCKETQTRVVKTYITQLLYCKIVIFWDVCVCVGLTECSSWSIV